MSRDIAASNKNLAISSAGISTAILTFTMIFLYDLVLKLEVDRIVFQIIIASIIVSIFTFTISFLIYDRSMSLYEDAAKEEKEERLEKAKAIRTKAKKDMDNGNRFTLFGLLIFLIQPALITYSIQMIEACWLSSILFLGLVSAIVYMSFRTRPELGDQNE